MKIYRKKILALSIVMATVPTAPSGALPGMARAIVDCATDFVDCATGSFAKASAVINDMPKVAAMGALGVFFGTAYLVKKIANYKKSKERELIDQLSKDQEDEEKELAIQNALNANSFKKVEILTVKRKIQELADILEKNRPYEKNPRFGILEGIHQKIGNKFFICPLLRDKNNDVYALEKEEYELHEYIYNFKKLEKQYYQKGKKGYKSWLVDFAREHLFYKETIEKKINNEKEEEIAKLMNKSTWDVKRDIKKLAEHLETKIPQNKEGHTPLRNPYGNYRSEDNEEFAFIDDGQNPFYRVRPEDAKLLMDKWRNFDRDNNYITSKRWPGEMSYKSWLVDFARAHLFYKATVQPEVDRELAESEDDIESKVEKRWQRSFAMRQIDALVDYARDWGGNFPPTSIPLDDCRNIRKQCKRFINNVESTRKAYEDFLNDNTKTLTEKTDMTTAYQATQTALVQGFREKFQEILKSIARAKFRYKILAKHQRALEKKARNDVY